MRWAAYTTDDGHLVALLVHDDTFALMLHEAPPAGTPVRPQGLVPRKQLFTNADGVVNRLPYATPAAVKTPGTMVTIGGDSTFAAGGTEAEINDGWI